MYSMRSSLVYLLIFTAVSSVIAYHLVVKAYDSFSYDENIIYALDSNPERD